MNKWMIVFAILLGLFFLGSQCASDPAHHSEEHHLLDKIRAHQKPLDYALVNNDLMDTAYLIKVHSNLPEVQDFLTEKKTHQLASFPCTNCHTQSLEKMQANRSAEIRNAHWDIELIHAKETTMNCTTCHSKKDMNQLTSLTGAFVNLNESFKVCAQCHSSQYKDWQGGAHGKQLNGWIAPRVATTCVSCHNPHQPAFPSRFPARLNTNDLGD